jgi:hypothetical protein
MSSGSPNVIGASFVNEPLHQWITLYTETLPNDTTLTPEKIAQHFLLDIKRRLKQEQQLLKDIGNYFRGHVVADMVYL